MAKKKRYSITMICEGFTRDSNFTWMDYPEAFRRAGEALHDHPQAWGILIHSDQKTGLIVTRKHYPALFPLQG